MKFKATCDRVDALSLRERGMIFIGAMVVIYIVAMNLLFSPLRAEHARVEAALKAKNEQIQAAHMELQAVLGSRDLGSEAGRAGKLATLEQELKGLDQQLDQMTGGLVSPQQMAKLLEQILQRNHGLELVTIQSMPRTLAVEETVVGNTKALGTLVYKHGVRIELRGRYFDIVNYLKALETLPWRIYWGEVELQSEQYPTSKLTLVVYTLSRHTGWIGV